MKVQYSQTTPNSRQRLLHTLLSLHWSGSRRFEEVRGGWTTRKQCTGTLHILLPLCRWGSRRFGTVEPLRTHVKDFYTPCLLCTEVVEGSRRFAVVEPLGNSVQVPYTSCYHCVDEVWEGYSHSYLVSILVLIRMYPDALFICCPGDGYHGYQGEQHVEDSEECGGCLERHKCWKVVWI